LVFYERCRQANSKPNQLKRQGTFARSSYSVWVSRSFGIAPMDPRLEQWKHAIDRFWSAASPMKGQ
jgi:hypothetical protein